MDARRPDAVALRRNGSGARSPCLPVRLAPHVHMCRAGGKFIFLDLVRDEYSALDVAQSRTFEALIASSKQADGAAKSLSEADNRLLATLSDAGLITNDPGVGRPPLAPVLAPPTMTAQRRTKERVSSSSFASAMLACARASIELSRRPLGAVVASVERRKMRVGGHPLDIPAMRSALAPFEAARLFYPRPYLCLFDSLALLSFFASRRLFPDWVFAVRATPFEAHCWVQAGDVAINEAAEVAATYTPILIV